MDNIYILQHVIEKATEKNKRKLFKLFVDLKAAFDNTCREKLWKTMENAGIIRKLVDRTGEICIKSRIKIKVDEKVSGECWAEEEVMIIHFAPRCLKPL